MTDLASFLTTLMLAASLLAIAAFGVRAPRCGGYRANPDALRRRTCVPPRPPAGPGGGSRSRP